MAHLIAMELIKAGFQTTMVNFGQPRVGDDAYAAFANTKFPNHFRVIHDRDIVPHQPTYAWPINYLHTRYEIFEDAAGKLRLCDASGEDKTCADQYSPISQRISDHTTYLGLCMGQVCGQCGSSKDAFSF